MTIRSRSRMVALAAGVVALAGALTPASAATPLIYRVSAGTTKTGSVTITGRTSTGTLASPKIRFTDTRTSTTIGCVSGRLHGKVSLGKVRASRFGTVTSTSYAGCTAFDGYARLAGKQVGTWYLNGVSRPVHGVSRVSVSNLKAVISSSTCTVTVSGVADGTYSNSTGRLSLAPRTGSGHAVRASHVGGCGGVIVNGDRIALVGSFSLSTRKGALKIS